MLDDLFSPRPANSSEDYRASLNEEQRLAVETTEGPLLILAGAGTGKTRVLTTRFAHILLQRLAWPEQILAVTFTNKAAREMRERVSHLLNETVDGLWLGTFHALCARMLRKHASRVGLERNFSILDSDDQIRLIKQVIAPFNLDTKKTPPPQILHYIQLWKDRAFLPEDITPAHDVDFAYGNMRAIYAAYQTRLKELNACDFGDLMLHMLTIFRRHPDVLAEYHARFRYILVDEYQDTNTIQYLWLRLLAKRPHGEPSNIACVGDDDQSIYSWRGAEVANILRFDKDFPNATIIRLEQNYRSTPRILQVASKVISHNSTRLGKVLRPGVECDIGEKITVINRPDSDDEARTVGNYILDLYKKGQKYRKMAILIRAGFQTRPFEEALMRFGIPYQVIGGLRFYERAEIRDATAYMRVLLYPNDDLAFERIINVPKRGFGNVALGKLRSAARERGLSLQTTLVDLLDKKLIKGKSADQLQDFVNVLHETRKTLKESGHVAAIDKLLEASGYMAMWRDDRRTIEAAGRLDNLRELIRAIGEFSNLEAFLEHIALVMDVDSTATEQDRVSIMTIHGAKGLEFPTVFLPGWEEGIFPSQRAMDESNDAGLEEERRLAYVALTRAQERIIILHANSRRIYATWQDSAPSRFIEELPKEHILRKLPEQTQRRGMRPSPFGSSYTRHSTAPSGIYRPSASQKCPSVSLGDTVKSARFGIGTVIEIEGEKLRIQFEKAGVKTIMAGFVEKVS